MNSHVIVAKQHFLISENNRHLFVMFLSRFAEPYIGWVALKGTFFQFEDTRKMCTYITSKDQYNR